MSVIKFILPETASFAANLIHHEERAKSSLDNIPNITNPLASNIESGNDNFTFKEDNSQPGSLGFVKYTRKETGSYEDDKHWTIVTRRGINRKNTTLSIWSFKRKRAPYGSIVKHKSLLCTNGGMQQWGVKNW